MGGSVPHWRAGALAYAWGEKDGIPHWGAGALAYARGSVGGVEFLGVHGSQPRAAVPHGQVTVKGRVVEAAVWVMRSLVVEIWARGWVGVSWASRM